MGAGVVSVGRRSYAVGLYWENSPEGRVAQTAKEAARQPGQVAEYYAVRAAGKEGRVPQFGLGQAAAGHKSGMASFAACLAGQQVGSWVGAFRTKEGIAVTIVRDDLILPDGDLLFEGETEARDRILQEMSFGGLQKVYAPEAWAIPGADTMPLSLLMNERHDVVLRPTSIPKNVIIGAAVVAGVIVLALAGGWYWQAREAEEQERIQQEAAIAQAAKEALAKLPGSTAQPAYPVPHRNWEDAVPALDLLEACRLGLSKVQIVVQGWHMDNMRCTGQSIDSSWTRDKGWTIAPSGFVVNEMGTSATSSVTLPPLKPRGHEDLFNNKDITKKILAENWPMTLSRMPDDPPPPPPAGYTGPWNPPPPPWVKRSFTVSVRELPSDLPSYWSGLPGVVINSIAYSGTGLGGTWSIEGVIYENRN